MNARLRVHLIFFWILFWLSACSLAQAATYYVAPGGNNSNPGTITQPFATIRQAHDVASAGDLIYVRGGTYTLTAFINITKNGSSGNYIRMWAYPGETPIIDAINLTDSSHPGIRMQHVSWWHVMGLEVKNAPADGIVIKGSSNNIIVEACNSHHNVRIQRSGAGIAAGSVSGDTVSNILLLNNDSHHNSYHLGGTGGDGIGVNHTQQTGNIIRGNRVWRNQDDGIDLWDAKNVLVENNWSWENGYDEALQYSGGNGTGFKLGGGGAEGGNHTIRNNLAWRNNENGFDDNGAVLPMYVYNNTSYENGDFLNAKSGRNFSFYSSAATVLKNNLSIPSSFVYIPSPTVQNFNSWNLAVTVSAADFITLDFSANTGPRQADGSLPVSNFLQPVAGSDFADKGTNVGIAYTGRAPDLGAYEYTNSVVSLQAPSNFLVQPQLR